MPNQNQPQSTRQSTRPPGNRLRRRRNADANIEDAVPVNAARGRAVRISPATLNKFCGRCKKLAQEKGKRTQ